MLESNLSQQEFSKNESINYFELEQENLNPKYGWRKYVDTHRANNYKLQVYARPNKQGKNKVLFAHFTMFNLDFEAIPKFNQQLDKRLKTAFKEF